MNALLSWFAPERDASWLSPEERHRLTELCAQIADGRRGDDHLDGKEASWLAFHRWLGGRRDCTCGQSDGDRCYCDQDSGTST